MPTHTTLSPVEVTVRAVDALLTALDASPTVGARTAYRAAITRHGRNLLEMAGHEALSAALNRIGADARDQAAEEREQIVTEAWKPLTIGAAA